MDGEACDMSTDECGDGTVCTAEMHEDPPASCTGASGCEISFDGVDETTCPMEEDCTYTPAGAVVEVHICREDTASGGTAVECTAVDTPYAECIVPTCTAVDTPYAGCTVPECTGDPDTPYTGCHYMGLSEWDACDPENDQCGTGLSCQYDSMSGTTVCLDWDTAPPSMCDDIAVEMWFDEAMGVAVALDVCSGGYDCSSVDVVAYSRGFCGAGGGVEIEGDGWCSSPEANAAEALCTSSDFGCIWTVGPIYTIAEVCCKCGGGIPTEWVSAAAPTAEPSVQSCPGIGVPTFEEQCPGSCIFVVDAYGPGVHGCMSHAEIAAATSSSSGGASDSCNQCHEDCDSYACEGCQEMSGSASCDSIACGACHDNCNMGACGDGDGHGDGHDDGPDTSHCQHLQLACMMDPECVVLFTSDTAPLAQVMANPAAAAFYACAIGVEPCGSAAIACMTDSDCVHTVEPTVCEDVSVSLELDCSKRTPFTDECEAETGGNCVSQAAGNITAEGTFAGGSDVTGQGQGSSTTCVPPNIDDADPEWVATCRNAISAGEGTSSRRDACESMEVEWEPQEPAGNCVYNPHTVTLAADASSVDHYYRGWQIETAVVVPGASGPSSYYGTVVSYDGISKELEVEWEPQEYQDYQLAQPVIWYTGPATNFIANGQTGEPVWDTLQYTLSSPADCMPSSPALAAGTLDCSSAELPCGIDAFAGGDGPMRWICHGPPEYNCGGFSDQNNCTLADCNWGESTGYTADEACCKCGGGVTRPGPDVLDDFPPNPDHPCLGNALCGAFWSCEVGNAGFMAPNLETLADMCPGELASCQVASECNLTLTSSLQNVTWINTDDIGTENAQFAILYNCFICVSSNCGGLGACLVGDTCEIDVVSGVACQDKGGRYCRAAGASAAITALQDQYPLCRAEVAQCVGTTASPASPALAGATGCVWMLYGWMANQVRLPTSFGSSAGQLAARDAYACIGVSSSSCEDDDRIDNCLNDENCRFHVLDAALSGTTQYYVDSPATNELFNCACDAPSMVDMQTLCSSDYTTCDETIDCRTIMQALSVCAPIALLQEDVLLNGGGEARTLRSCIATALVAPRDTEPRCQRPQVGGYDFSAAVEDLRLAKFSVTGIRCAPGHGGLPNATACISDGGEYTLDGCISDTNVLMTYKGGGLGFVDDLPGWSFDVDLGTDPCTLAGISCSQDDEARVSARFGAHGFHWDKPAGNSGHTADASQPETSLHCSQYPCPAPLLGTIGFTDVGGSIQGTAFPAGEEIFGPFEAGFGAQQATILEAVGCPPGLGYVPGGIDTHSAERMVAHECGIRLPRREDGLYISFLDECGGHTRSYHFHERMSCLYETKHVPGTAGGHSPRIGTALDGRGICELLLVFLRLHLCLQSALTLVAVW
jgi:hypothetical protein